MTALTNADLPVTDPTSTHHDHPRPSATPGTRTEFNTTTEANCWLTTHYREIVQRAWLRHGHLDHEARDEAIAETLAYTTQAVHGAARRGTLDRLTPWTCVRFAGKHIEQGRRNAGSSSRCPLSRECQQRHGIHTHSLDDDTQDTDVDYHEAIADPKADQPIDAIRRRLDFPKILYREAVSSKAQATFRFLAATHGSGKQTDLATELMVSPARITQLKAELAHALTTDDYHGPLGRRPRQA